MSKRKRIPVFAERNRIATESPLRRMWFEKGQDTAVLRIHLMNLERQGVNIAQLQK